MQRVAANRNPAVDKFGAGKNGFTAGDPQAGVSATTPGAEWFDAVQEELVNLLEGLGGALDPAKRDQIKTQMLAALAGKADKATTLGGYAIAIATQAQAEAGADNAVPMTPLRVAQAIAKLAPTPAGVRGAHSNLKSAAVAPIAVSGNTTNASNQIANVASIAGLIASGTYITGAGIPAGSYITGISGAGPYTLTISNNATATAAGVSLTAYILNNRTTTADALVVSDGAGNYKTLLNVSVTGNIGTVGANGLDAGALAANTWYYEHVIYNPPTATAAKLYSLSATAPTLPAGFTMWARTGVVRADANKILLYVSGSDRLWEYVVTPGTNVPSLPVLASGTGGAPATPTFAAASVSSLAPPTAVAVDLLLNNPASGMSCVAPNPNYGTPSSTTNPPPLIAWPAVANTAVSSGKKMLLESTNIYYASGHASVALFLLGWEDNL